MDKAKVKCISCFVGIWDGKMLNTDYLENEYPKWQNDGILHIGVLTDWLDQKKKPHTRFKYCPQCGEKISFRKIRYRLNKMDFLEYMTVEAEKNVHPRICMWHLGNHRRGNPVADWICYFPEEVMRVQ